MVLRWLTAKTQFAPTRPHESPGASGVEPGTEHWLRAQFAAVAAARRDGNDAEACNGIESILVLSRELDAQVLAELATARERCSN